MSTISTMDRTASVRGVRRIRHRLDPVPQPHETLVLKIRGHYTYYGRRGNYKALSRCVRLVTKI